MLISHQLCFTADVDGSDEIIPDTVENTDLGPSPKLTHNSQPGDEDIMHHFGYLDTGADIPKMHPHSATINMELQQCVKDSPNKKTITVDWPDIADTAVNEYGDRRLFVHAFPWLFPGGLGDVYDSPLNSGAWGKQMLYYRDGRFAADPIFSFYVTNYIIRHRNSSSGKWYVDKFNYKCPETLEELKETIRNGDTSFINTLNYYNKRVKGSTPYWTKKRSELYTWINYHVEQGKGAPMFFITLSCAEYFWADVVDLLRDRLELAGQDTSDIQLGSTTFKRMVNDYSIVIQEYFQRRVEIWLETVGKEIFGIDHYWVRFEFAPGRGQIHAHLLAIPRNQSIYKLCHATMKEEGGAAKRDQYLAEWASKKFGLTASVAPGFESIPSDKSQSPSTIRFEDVGPTLSDQDADTQKLMKHLQLHDCSAFCMRAGNSNWYVENICFGGVLCICSLY